ncbi:MAG: hypothetical protein ACT4N5_03030 [Nitrosopumilaceae archaeon]
MTKKTSIALSKKIRDELAALGTKDQNFEEIIVQLLKKWEFEK